MQPFDQTSNNFYQGYLFSHPAFNAMQFYAIPPSPHPVFPQVSPPHPTRPMFIPPPWLPPSPFLSYAAPQPILHPASSSGSPIPRQAATPLGTNPMATHAYPAAAQELPPQLTPEHPAAPPSPSPNPISGPNPDFSTSSPDVQRQSQPKFKGEAEVRIKGRREILFYRIPDSTMVYSFKVISKKENVKNCFCIGCLKKEEYAGVKAIGTDFLTDPCELRHVCRPTKRRERKMKRIKKKKSQKKRVQSFEEIRRAKSVYREKSMKGKVTEKKHRLRPIPFKEKKPTITMETIMLIKSFETLVTKDECKRIFYLSVLDEEFKRELIGQILQGDEEHRRKRREYRQRKKAEKEAAKLLEQSNGHPVESSSSKVQKKTKKRNIW
ncbi:hypothetical protein ANCCEY_14883 [Ancylostoma ceylanicum]|uniref:Uncharacterized protein n=1 Tax=Ancylostoma ceylanicum TaxID=53326 RepID=A0A0D6L4D2_9BILA|nr:hypothetical protein ANCCEY_14883 [Ancylostoma ceylanicum]